MDEVWGDELGEEGREDIGEEDRGLGDTGADEIERCGEDNNIDDIVYET